MVKAKLNWRFQAGVYFDSVRSAPWMLESKLKSGLRLVTQSRQHLVWNLQSACCYFQCGRVLTSEARTAACIRTNQLRHNRSWLARGDLFVWMLDWQNTVSSGGENRLVAQSYLTCFRLTVYVLYAPTHGWVCYPAVRQKTNEDQD